MIDIVDHPEEGRDHGHEDVGHRKAEGRGRSRATPVPRVFPGLIVMSLRFGCRRAVAAIYKAPTYLTCS